MLASFLSMHVLGYEGVVLDPKFNAAGGDGDSGKFLMEGDPCGAMLS